MLPGSVLITLPIPFRMPPKDADGDGGSEPIAPDCVKLKPPETSLKAASVRAEGWLIIVPSRILAMARR